MNYELAEQLKNSGFPQERGRLVGMGRKNFDGTTSIYKPVCHPDVDTLIDELQKKYGKKYVAFSELKPHFTENDLLEQSLAKLWIRFYKEEQL